MTATTTQQQRWNNKSPTRKREKEYFNQYYSEKKWAQWAKDKVFLEGTLRFMFNTRKSFVMTNTFGKAKPFQVLINSSFDANHVFEGDTVIVELCTP